MALVGWQIKLSALSSFGSGLEKPTKPREERHDRPACREPDPGSDHRPRHRRAGRRPARATRSALRRHRLPQRSSHGDSGGPRHRAGQRTTARQRHVDVAGRALVTTTLPGAVTAAPAREPSHRVVLIVLSLAAFMASLDLFIVNVAF